jgi:hypothetical protein
MPKFISGVAVFTVLTAISFATSATQVFKCTINGTVSYQAVPCPSGPPGKQPTLEQLNAAEKLKRERQASASPARAPAPSGPRALHTNPVVSSPSAAPAELPGRSFRCDGRKHCSQMTSCAEAKYFLSNCPDVKMDGDGDGIPCEDQWCGGGSR